MRKILFFLLMFPHLLFADAKRYSYENISYIFHSRGVESSAAQMNISIIHPVFSSEFESLSERFNVKRDYSFTVNLTSDAGLFKKLTGLDMNTGGAYIAESRSFFFQRPFALERSGNLRRIVRHEILHYLIDCAREGREGELWLDEGYCEWFEPVMNLKSISLPRIKEDDEFRKVVAALLKSSDTDKRRKGYLMAMNRVKRMIDEKGEDYVWSQVTGR